MPNLHNDFDYSEHAVLATVTKNTSTTIDLKVDVSSHYLTGGILLYRNSVWGDYIEAQIVDIDDVLGYGADTVLKHYIKKRYLHPSESVTKINVDYAGEIPKDTYLRIIYHSVGTVLDVDVAVNYHLHELA